MEKKNIFNGYRAQHCIAVRRRRHVRIICWLARATC